MANPKLKAAPAPIEEDEDLDDIVDGLEDEEDEADTVHAEPTPLAARKMPVAKPARPVIVSPPPGEEDVSDTDFDKEAKKRKDAQKVNDYLERKRTEETTSVDEITELMMEGNTDQIMRELVPYCADNSGIKTAKQLLREARDRAKARVTRIAGVVSVMLDELKEEDDSGGGSRD